MLRQPRSQWRGCCFFLTWPCNWSDGGYGFVSSLRCFTYAVLSDLGATVYPVFPKTLGPSFVSLCFLAWHCDIREGYLSQSPQFPFQVMLVVKRIAALCGELEGFLGSVDYEDMLESQEKDIPLAGVCCYLDSFSLVQMNQIPNGLLFLGLEW